MTILNTHQVGGSSTTQLESHHVLLMTKIVCRSIPKKTGSKHIEIYGHACTVESYTAFLCLLSLHALCWSQAHELPCCRFINSYFGRLSEQLPQAVYCYPLQEGMADIRFGNQDPGIQRARPFKYHDSSRVMASTPEAQGAEPQFAVWWNGGASGLAR